MTLEDLIFTALSMLLGAEDVFWEFYEDDPDWWQVHLQAKQN